MAQRMIFGWSLGLLVSIQLSATIGDNCRSDLDCGRQEQCILDFPKGYCVKYSCKSRHSCGSNAKCMMLVGDNFTVCLKECSQTDDCRTGYHCNNSGVCLP